MSLSFRAIRLFVAAQYARRVASAESIKLLAELEHENAVVAESLEQRKRVASKFTGRLIFGRTLQNLTLAMSVLLVVWWYDTDEGRAFRAGMMEGWMASTGEPLAVSTVHTEGVRAGVLNGSEYYEFVNALYDQRMQQTSTLDMLLQHERRSAVTSGRAQLRDEQAHVTSATTH